MLNIIQDKPVNELFCISKTTIQIDRTDQGLHSIGNHGITLSSAGGLLALSQKQIAAQLQIGCAVSQGRLAHQAGADLGELSLRLLRVLVIQEITGNHFQNGITQKLQTFVADCLVLLMFIGIGTVGQGAVEQIFVPKGIAAPALQLV